MVKVHDFMKRVGLKNQTELAKKLGIKQGTVSAWAVGASSPTYEKCIELLEMGMTVEELFGKQYPQTAEKPHGDMDRLVAESLKRMVEKMGI